MSKNIDDIEKFAKWKGINRSEIEWHPKIDESKCVGCGMCVTSCGRNVFDFDFKRNKALVAQPNNCMVGCTSCETWCIFDAISFPDKEYVKGLLKKRRLLNLAKKELEEKISKKHLETRNESVNKTLGFIGGGRITKIILQGLKRAGKMSHDVIISDINTDTLNRLKEMFPEISIVSNNKKVVQQEIIFLAVHPNVMEEVLTEIKPYLKADSILVSLAPKITIKSLSEKLDGFKRIVRMIPNAPTYLNKGYNPIAFSEGISEEERIDLCRIFTTLGESPIVEEEKLEAYAILTAMGPTYLWFQFDELQKIGKSFGLSDQEINEGMYNMLIGSIKMFYESELSYEEIIDLIPGKPLKDEEENIRKIYRDKLETLFNKLKSR